MSMNGKKTLMKAYTMNETLYLVSILKHFVFDKTRCVTATDSSNRVLVESFID